MAGKLERGDYSPEEKEGRIRSGGLQRGNTNVIII